MRLKDRQADRCGVGRKESEGRRSKDWATVQRITCVTFIVLRDEKIMIKPVLDT